MKTNEPQSWRELFASDLEAWRQHGWRDGGTGRAGKILMVIRHTGLRATLIHRIAHHANRHRWPGVSTMLMQLNVALHAIELVPGVPIGPGLYMPHTVGTVINARSIGANVEIQGGITVGQKNGGNFPTIGDGVALSAGCRVLGNIFVGCGATIGANAVVTKNVRPGATMLGVPAREYVRDADPGQCPPDS